MKVLKVLKEIGRFIVGLLYLPIYTLEQIMKWRSMRLLPKYYIEDRRKRIKHKHERKHK